jgi:hypothetical protein
LHQWTPNTDHCHLYWGRYRILPSVTVLLPSVAQRLQSFSEVGGSLREASTPPPAWLLSAQADYDARQLTLPRESRIHKALHTPAGHTLVCAFDATGALVGAMSYRVRSDPTDLFLTSLGSTGDLPGTGVALLAHLAQVSLHTGLAVRASLDPLAFSFYQSLGWVEIEPGDPGHKWRWPLACRTELAELTLPIEPALAL